MSVYRTIGPLVGFPMRGLVTFRGSGQTQRDLLRQGGCYIRSAFKTFLFGGVFRQIYDRNVFVSGLL